MTLCYCGIRVSDNTDNPNHPECDAEYARREKEYLCLKCGQKDARPGSAWCGSCNSFSFYLDYPGGSS